MQFQITNDAENTLEVFFNVYPIIIEMKFTKKFHPFIQIFCSKAKSI